MLYVGIDISKSSHVAAFLSPVLLNQYHSFERCPVLPFDQSRTGFETLFSVMTRHAPASHCHVLLENTGHYGRALEQFLQEKGVAVYRVSVQERQRGQSKNDKRDAQSLAVLLYNQVEQQVLVADASQRVRRLVPPSDTARLLQGLVQHRHELVRELTRRKNKLTAIADEVFPELTQIYKNPNGAGALALREAFPRPQAIAEASLEDLAATRKHNRPGNALLVELQALACRTIGAKDESRLACLLLEQKQLIAEVRLMQAHVETLNAEIEQAVAQSREGQILTSFPMIGPILAANLIAGIGSIANFESVAKLRSFCGWSPVDTQTGISKDSSVLRREGHRLLKQTIYLIAMQSIRTQTPWRDLYDRLVPLKCQYDERLKRYRGRMKVVGRVAGQIVQVIYTLLKRDYDLLQRVSADTQPPPPELYDVKKHRIQRK